MIESNKLRLDEALVSVNRSSAIQEPLEVYYQIDECFGCPLDKLTTLTADNKLQEFVIGTKYQLQLELRRPADAGAHLGRDNISGISVCRLENLTLNNHGHYKINLSPSSGHQNECTFETIEKGDCLLCPFAILLCLLFVVTILERLFYSRFVGRSKASRDKREISRLDGSAAPESIRVAQAGQTSRAAQQVAREVSTVPDGGSEPESPSAAHENGQLANSSHQEPKMAGEQQQLDLEHQPAAAADGNLMRGSRHRIEALDAFRGLTIAGMIFVNYGGAGYSLFEHKAWNGITLADFVFPFFIFSMGASIAISGRSMVKRGKPLCSTLAKIVRRSIILMALGLCLNSKWLANEESLNRLRLTGVLQRFSISYLVVAFMYSVELSINKWIKAQSLYRIPFVSGVARVLFELLTAFNYLAIYVYVSFYINYSDTCPPGYTGPGGLTDGGQFRDCTGGAAAWLDRVVLGENHLYQDQQLKRIFHTKVTHDPEGILGYTTSILLTIIGLQCGKALIRFKQHRARLVAFSQWILMLTLASALILLIPINKRLWSLTFVTVTASAAFLTMALIYILVEIQHCQRTFLLRLLISAGKNSILLYVGHSLLAGMLPWHFSVDQTSHLQLLLRLSWSTLAWLLIAHYLAKRRIFVKI